MTRSDFQQLPRHLAVIMDGNGRWAKERGLPRTEGHRRGAQSVRVTLDFCAEVGIEYLTLYAFSSENWKRPAIEVQALMFLLESYLKSELKELKECNVRLRAIGDLSRLPDRCRVLLEKSIAETQGNTGVNLTLALSYGSRDEIIHATKKLCSDVVSGKRNVEDITPQVFSEYLYTHDIPDPDLLIRTSGEMRISNFLLWQLSYAEIYVTKTFWPDFSREHLLEAMRDFELRHRRYGASS